VTGAWPKKWSVSDFSAETSDVVIETLELAYQTFRVD
jgi:phage tail-like protein